MDAPNDPLPKLTSLARTALYIHVPFCTRKCGYCDFYSVELGAGSAAGAFAKRVCDAGIEQMDWFLDATGHPAIETVFIGGGTPSVLPIDAGAAFFKAIAERVGEPEEWSVEVNPETVTPELLGLYGRSGVTRLSVGIQSFDAINLRILDRRATPERNRQALAEIRKNWQGQLSLDLICGLPRQVPADLARDIREALVLSPDHISLYSLTVEPGTPLESQISAGKIPAPEDDAATDTWLTGVAALVEAGYEQYEISNFAKDGAVCRHNLAYWHLDPYIGIGPAGVSTICDDRGVVRTTGPRDLQRFLGGEAAHWGLDWERIEPAEFLLEHLLMGLRLADGVDVGELNRRFAVDLVDLLEGPLETWIEASQVSLGPQRFRIEAHARHLLDSILGDVAYGLRDIAIPRVNWP